MDDRRAFLPALWPRTRDGMSFAAMAPETIAPARGRLPHNNMQPYLTLNFCIALQRVFPERP
jgi:microcystin-dependent protein